MSPLKSPLSAKLPPKQLLSPNKFDDGYPRKSADGRILEKSNSLSESNPSKQIKTAKSLSPRPPIKHQKALDDGTPKFVMKVSAATEDENTNNLRIDIEYEKKKNRSTSCLVYVPSDPWTKMDSKLPANVAPPKKGAKRMKKLMDVKSQSKPDLIDTNDDNDPWVRLDDTNGNRKSNRSATTYRQSKSLHIDTKSGTARPRLQRSKSPNPIDTKDPLSSLSPTFGYHLVPEKHAAGGPPRTKKKGQQQQQFLNVSNPNLLQQSSRHSFSTSPTSSSSGNGSNGVTNKRDDELTLNIRRLSEQIKYSSTYVSYGNFYATPTNVTTNNKHTNDNNTTDTKMEKSASLLSDSLLETTC